MTCGGGIHSRNRICVDADKLPLNDESCDGGNSQEELPCHQYECLPCKSLVSPSVN